MTARPHPLNRLGSLGQPVALAGVAAAVLASTAAWVAHKARRARQLHPPHGKYVTVDGVRMHYVERGEGTPLVLLHGNAVHLGDFEVSGLIDRLAQRFRVIAFDRPGFGHSERPRDRLWTAEAQASLVDRAMAQAGIRNPIVVGHSWGTLVALELALRPSAHVQKLILISGYYYPTARLDVALAAPPAIPVVGDILRYTVSAVSARLLIARTVEAMFAPQPVPRDYLATLGREMLVRPIQIRASAEDAAFMVPAAAALRKRYRELKMPTVIFAGGADKVIDPDDHARKLHAELSHSDLHLLPGLGHMLHHAACGQLASVITRTTVPTAPLVYAPQVAAADSR